MKVILRTIYAGPAGTAHPGQVISLPDEAALPLIKAGYAEEVPSARANTEPVLIVKSVPIPPAPLTAGERKTKIAEAVELLVDDGKDLTGAGAPKMEALNALLGFSATAAERDIAMEGAGKMRPESPHLNAIRTAMVAPAEVRKAEPEAKKPKPEIVTDASGTIFRHRPGR